MVIPYLDLRPLHAEIRPDLDRAMARVVESGVFLNGGQVEEWERAWSEYTGQRYCVACASGTDAIALIAYAGKFAIPANTCRFTQTGLLKNSGWCIEVVDCGPDGRFAPDARLWSAFDNLRPLDVLLYGRFAYHTDARLFDACQAHGWKPPKGSSVAWSAYPTKCLGGLGDGGMVTTDSFSVAKNAAQRRETMHSRLSELNAAILRTKLHHLDRWNAERHDLAAVYYEELPDWAEPVCRPGEPTNHHIFAVLLDRRDDVKRHLEANGVGVKIHYPEPLAPLPGAVRWTQRVLSLPLWIGMKPEQVRTVCDTLKGFS